MDVCLNYWPLPLGVIVDMSKDSICRLCGNWLTEKVEIVDIEDIAKRDSKCINEYKKV
jgi:hypothetical protein